MTHWQRPSWWTGHAIPEIFVNQHFMLPTHKQRVYMELDLPSEPVWLKEIKDLALGIRRYVRSDEGMIVDKLLLGDAPDVHITMRTFYSGKKTDGR